MRLEGPIAIAESIAPANQRPRKHVVHLIFAGAVADDQFSGITSEDAAVRGHRLVPIAEMASTRPASAHPPLPGALAPGDPFVHLGQLWAR